MQLLGIVSSPFDSHFGFAHQRAALNSAMQAGSAYVANAPSRRARSPTNSASSSSICLRTHRGVSLASNSGWNLRHWSWPEMARALTFDPHSTGMPPILLRVARLSHMTTSPLLMYRWLNWELRTGQPLGVL
jgi:hypothetical protein